jgi:hypothetical protein
MGSKLLEQMRRNPRGDWSMEDIVRVCNQAGIRCVPPRAGGSHYKVYCADMPEILTVPYKRPIKPVYIRRLVAFIDEAGKDAEQT